MPTLEIKELDLPSPLAINHRHYQAYNIPPLIDVVVPISPSPRLSFNFSTDMSNGHDTAPALGGKWAVLLFIVTLLAFVAESQLAQVREQFFLYFAWSKSILTVYLFSMFKPHLISANHTCSCEPFRYLSTHHQTRSNLIQLSRSFVISHHVSHTPLVSLVDKATFC